MKKLKRKKRVLIYAGIAALFFSCSNSAGVKASDIPSGNNENEENKMEIQKEYKSYSQMPWAGNTVNDGYGEYMFVPEGEFLMGDNFNEGHYSQRPVHMVYLDSYYIGKYEISNGEYKKFMNEKGYEKPEFWKAGGFGLYGKNPEYWHKAESRGGGIEGNEDFPVVGVCRYEAEAYCAWLSAKTGVRYRLPTEAEWEKAARGTDQRKYAWGDYIDGTYANYYRSGDPYEDELCPLGGFTPVGFFDGKIHDGFSTNDNSSPYGAFDMVGNVLEWCSDFFDHDYYSKSPYENPAGPETGEYVFYGEDKPENGEFISARSGFWTDNSRKMIIETLSCSCRSPVTEGPGKRKSRLGFRCVRELN